MLTTASEQLRNAGFFVLERYLRLATFQAASAKILRRRLFEDRGCWDDKFGKIFRLLDDTEAWYRALQGDMLWRLDDRSFSFARTADIMGELAYLDNVSRSGTAMLKETLRVINQENAYMDNLLQLFMQQNARQRHIIQTRYMSLLQPRLDALRVRLDGLLKTLDFRTTVSGARPEYWGVSLRAKVHRDLPTLRGSAVEEAVNKSLSTVRGGIDDLVTLHKQLRVLGLHVSATTALLGPRMASSTGASAGFEAAVRRAQQHSEIRRVEPAAMRELMRLDLNAGPRSPERAAALVAARWLRLLNCHPDLQDPLLGVRRARRRMMPVARRGDLATEARSMLDNERLARRQRAANREARFVGVPDDPTAGELRLAAGDMAGTGEHAVGDREWLLDFYTEARVQKILDGLDDLTDEERAQNEPVQSVEAAVGLVQRLGI